MGANCPNCLKLSKIDKEKYNNINKNISPIWDNYIGYHKKCDFICKKSHIISISMKSFSEKTKCSECEKISKINNNNLKIIDYISDSKIKCECIECGYNIMNNYRNLSYKDFKCRYCKFIDKYEIFEKFDLLEFIDNNKVKIKCNKGHTFERLINNLKSKLSCVECFSSKRMTESGFIFESNIKHNNKYDYSDLNFKTLREKVNIGCVNHGIFSQTPSNHLQGKGCPRCKSSHGENIIHNYLKLNEINYESEFTFTGCISHNKRKLKFDFYLSEYNLCIEYDGEQHFKSMEFFGGEKGFVKIKNNDKIKDEYCRNNNIHLLRIPYYKKDQTIIIVEKFLETI